MVNWGIIGTGWIAEKMAGDFRRVKGARIVAVAARELSRAQAFASRFGISRAYGSYEQLAADAGVDIVYIATPHNFHLEHTMLCLKHGKHVLCEKPATVNAAEFSVMRAEAERRHLFLMEAFWTNFLPTTQKALEWVKSGVLGRIELIQANLGFVMRNDPQGRFFNPNLAAGSLLDLAVYNLNFGRLMAQSLEKSYSITAQMTDRGIDNVDSIQVEYQNGVSGLYATSSDALLVNDAYIIGTQGKVIVSDFHMSRCAQLIIGERVAETFTDRRTTAGYDYEAQSVTDCLRRGLTENPLRTLDDTESSMKLLDAMRQRIGLRYPFEK
ncbi:MAG: Gfo/Idh/MocA family oxidoreductase [Salinivirgaceae bacterium]|nr:Gfo/Idh/MocA family oxidoreductase [Salinivirgaceae bacterium]